MRRSQHQLDSIKESASERRATDPSSRASLRAALVTVFAGACFWAVALFFLF